MEGKIQEKLRGSSYSPSTLSKQYRRMTPTLDEDLLPGAPITNKFLKQQITEKRPRIKSRKRTNKARAKKKKVGKSNEKFGGKPNPPGEPNPPPITN
jgi:hypothetical protein